MCIKVFTSNLRDFFYMKIIVTIIPTDLVTNSLLSSLCSFLQTKNKNQKQNVGRLVTRNISDFCLWRVAFYFKAMPNSIDFNKGVFVHVIPVPIIVS